ncbi:restriction endonuclease subunit S [Veillonella montpellierensis]|uniref:restriction endonuclease subunit S n=1 Tax=Veillonella montpellierensis TaxID=187328 RepID=UPI0023F65F01|nr:restriction endonuclease subunit S [Veillonella montpellierensis]
MFEKNLYKKQTIENLCFDGRGRVINQDYIRLNSGKYPVYSSQTTNQGIFGFIDTFDFDGEYVTWTTDGANAGTVFYRNGKFNCTNVCGTLKAKTVNINMIYLSFALGMVAKDHVSHVGNDKLMNEAVKKILIPVPPKELQDKFASYVEDIDKLKFVLCTATSPILVTLL